MNTDSVKLRPVHVVKLGDWRLNWRVGRYPWFIWDYNGLAFSLVLRWFYISAGRVAPGGDEDD